MPRIPRQQHCATSAYYHVMNRGHNREMLFRDAQDCQHFLALLGRYRDRFALRIYHYCVMGNHFHLLVQLVVGGQCLVSGMVNRA